jgi:protease-4
MENEQPDKDTAQQKAKIQSWERELLEKLAFVSLEEGRKARRWGIAFKLFTAVYLVILLLLFLGGNWGEKALASKYSALVDMDGVIEAGGEVSADAIITGLRGAFEDKAAVGVILRANSPGGSPVQSAYIYDEIGRLREKFPHKPVYAVIGDICASGCYYVAAATNKIYANPSSLVGSIGVLMDGFGFVESMKKLGVERRLLTAGENKGMLDPFSPADPKAQRHAQKMLDEVHQQFIDAVKKGRGDALKKNREIFSGLFWSGIKAKELGLVDEFGSAGFVAREVIGAEDIVDFSVHENLLQRLAGRIGMAMGRSVATELRLRGPGLR